jgi:hypothetical protein
MADDDALFQKGMPIRREVLGPEYVDAMARSRLLVPKPIAASRRSTRHSASPFARLKGD